MVLELDAAAEAQLVKEAAIRGLQPEELAVRLVTSALRAQAPSSENGHSGSAGAKTVAAVREELRLAMQPLLHVAPQILESLDRTDDATLERRYQAAQALSTFAIDHNIQLPHGVTVEDLLEEGRS